MKRILSVFVATILLAGFINAQGKMAIGFNGGIALPMGDFGDLYSMGFGGSALFVYHISPNADITGSAGYLTWSGKDSFSDYKFNSIPVLAGVRYSFGKGKFNPYVSGELGVHFTTVDVPEIVILGITVSGGSASDTFFGFGAGVGFLYQVGNNMDLDVNAKYNSVSSSGGSSNYISIMAGLLFGLN